MIEPLADEKGLSAKELASLLGVRSEYLTRWKSGRNIPKEDSENYQAYQDFCKREFDFKFE
ncbi:helix-turn-helix domain-containing protein [Crocosphaera sp.]|uniref:helix-turn-helix domain-containing protein n=1 Tax=Crocosphaera sp. TaxID=2729996 RepID=UPI003F2794D5